MKRKTEEGVGVAPISHARKRDELEGEIEEFTPA